MCSKYGGNSCHTNGHVACPFLCSLFPISDLLHSAVVLSWQNSVLHTRVYRGCFYLGRLPPPPWRKKVVKLLHNQLFSSPWHWVPKKCVSKWQHCSCYSSSSWASDRRAQWQLWTHRQPHSKRQLVKKSWWASERGEKRCLPSARSRLIGGRLELCSELTTARGSQGRKVGNGLRSKPSVTEVSEIWMLFPYKYSLNSVCTGGFTAENLLATPDGGFVLASSPMHTNITIPRSMKTVASQETKDPTALKAFYNYNGQFNTSVPPKFEIWFNVWV